jgi:hypothetical protein
MWDVLEAKLTTTGQVLDGQAANFQVGWNGTARPTWEREFTPASTARRDWGGGCLCWDRLGEARGAYKQWATAERKSG